jgi:hypothetical protein
MTILHNARARIRDRMPLRKKHVRWVLFTLAMAGGLGVPVGLVVYGVHLGGGAYGRAMERALASHLRCDAAVEGARPTGLATAAADAVRLEWTAADGRMTLDLSDVAAVRNPDGGSWTVEAAEGRLVLAGEDAEATLAAVNQRLVQVDAALPVHWLDVHRLDLDLALGPVRVEAATRFAVYPDDDGLTVRIMDPSAPKLLPFHKVDPEAIHPLARLRLAPTDGGGVFAGLHADLEDLPADAVRRALRLGKPAATARGTARVTVNWHWAEADADAATVSAAVRDLDLAAWTASAPGGPIEGTADLAVRYRRAGPGDTAVALRLEAGEDASVPGETLAWLDRLGWPAAVPGAPPTGRVPLARFRVGLLVENGRGRFVGTPDRWGGIPVATVRLLAYDVPVLRASAAPFDATGLWTAVRKALSRAGDGGNAPAPAAFARLRAPSE